MSKPSDRWMPFYVGDYLADTMHLSALDHGVYLLLIMHYWRTGPLPDCDADLARVARLGPEEWGGISQRIRGFFTPKKGRLYHKRIDAEKERAENNTKKRAACGRKGGLAKAENSKQDQCAASFCQGFASDSLEQKPRPVPVPVPSKKEVPSLRSGGEPPPPDARAALWKDGLASLMNLTGQPDRKPAGKLLGKLSDLAGGDHAMLLALIREAEIKQPDHVYPWLVAAIHERKGCGTLFDVGRENDPWGILGWASRQPDAVDAVAGPRNLPCRAIKGRAIESSATALAEAAGLPETWRGNWDAFGDWLREDIDVSDRTVLDAVQSQATRMETISSMAVFSKAVHNAYNNRRR